MLTFQGDSSVAILAQASSASTAHVPLEFDGHTAANSTTFEPCRNPVMSAATVHRRQQRAHTLKSLKSATWQARGQALVYEALLKADPEASEFVGRLQAVLPAIAAEVVAATNGQPTWSSSQLLPPDAQAMSTAAKHEYRLPFDHITPQIARRLRRGGKKRKRTVVLLPPIAPPADVQPPPPPTKFVGIWTPVLASLPAALRAKVLPPPPTVEYDQVYIHNTVAAGSSAVVQQQKNECINLLLKEQLQNAPINASDTILPVIIHIADTLRTDDQRLSNFPVEMPKAPSFALSREAKDFVPMSLKPQVEVRARSSNYSSEVEGQSGARKFSHLSQLCSLFQRKLNS